MRRQVGEEICYDYRFCGDEQLPCNCGAASCRGQVNEQQAGAGRDRRLVVPRSQLKPHKKC